MEYLPVVALIISVAGFLIERFVFDMRQAERITRLEVKTEIWWNAVGDRITDMLKSPTHLGKDILLEKMKCRRLEMEEAEALRTILVEEMNANKRDSVAHVLAIARLDQILADKMVEKKKEKRRW